MRGMAETRTLQPLVLHSDGGDRPWDPGSRLIVDFSSQDLMA
jgi:hypothetical protein